jgi:hypothetical protein
MQAERVLGLLCNETTEQTLGLTIARLVNTVEMLRQQVRAEGFDEAGREIVLGHLNEIETLPGELMLACEILAGELPEWHAGHWPLIQLWFSAFDEIEAQKARFNEALKVAVELDAGPRH